MGVMVNSFLWVLQDFYHQPYRLDPRSRKLNLQGIRVSPNIRGLIIRIGALRFYSISMHRNSNPEGPYTLPLWNEVRK